MPTVARSYRLVSYSKTMKYADVIVNVSSRDIDAPFTYAIPQSDEFADIAIGCLVEAPLGRFRNVQRTVPGFVVGFRESLDFAGEVKPLVQVISGPHFTEDAVELARWMSDYYASPLANCLNLFTPPLSRTCRRG